MDTGLSHTYRKVSERQLLHPSGNYIESFKFIFHLFLDCSSHSSIDVYKTVFFRLFHHDTINNKMLKFNYFFTLLVVGIVQLTIVNGLYFHIAETERKCFIEEIPDETTVLGKCIAYRESRKILIGRKSDCYFYKHLQ